MKKVIILFIILMAVIFNSCNKSDDYHLELEFVPTDIILKTKNTYSIDKVFSFINLFDHEIEKITYGTYISELPTDSLQYVLNYIDEKPYTIDSIHKTTGYIGAKTNKITIFPKLHEMNNKVFQNDWIETINELKLNELDDDELGGHNMLIHAPKGKEKKWVDKFKNYDIVEWVELNYISEIEHN